jgi:hypothetical protein
VRAPNAIQHSGAPYLYWPHKLQIMYSWIPVALNSRSFEQMQVEYHVANRKQPVDKIRDKFCVPQIDLCVYMKAPKSGTEKSKIRKQMHIFMRRS